MRARRPVRSALRRWRRTSKRIAPSTKPTVRISAVSAASRPAVAPVPPSATNGIHTHAAANSTTGRLRRGGWTAEAPAQMIRRSPYAEPYSPDSQLSTATPATAP